MKNISSKKIFLLLLFTLSTFALRAQTNVSGFISANTTWDLAGSPYIVVGNALVSHGYTLTIKPGVVVKLDTNRTLQIDGELIAIGNIGARITFTSLQPSPKDGDWGKLHFSDTCVDAVFDTLGNYVSGCIMKYCDVLYGGSLGFGEIHIEGSSPYFSQCNILNSSTAGIYCDGSTYFIDSSAIKNCLGDGLSFINYFLTSCDLVIASDTLESNMKAGINLAPVPNDACNYGNILIQNNYFLSNNNCAIVYSPLYPKITIAENYFLNNSGQGIINLYNGADNVIIECNRFINNQPSHGGVIINSYNSISGIIQNNIFDGNIASSSASILSFSSWVLTITNNIFRNNSAISNSCCQISANMTATPSLFIHYNEFLNNISSSTLKISGGLTNSGNFIFSDIKFNNFIDANYTQIYLYDNIAYGSANIYADSNYWGTTSTQHIDSVIYDYFDYGNQSVVYYMPILTTPVAIDTSCSGSFPTGIKNVAEVINSKAFPNPFSNSTEVRFGKELKDGEVMIYNVFGQRMRVMEHVSGDRVIISRGNLCSGVYIYDVLDKQGRVGNGKLVVE